MKNNLSGRRVSALAFAALVFGCSMLAPGCASQAVRTVADQNAANASAYAANVSMLSGAARDLAQAQAAALVQQARERVATDLIRLRATITPSTPSDSDLSDPGTPWAKSLAAEAATLAARVNIAPPDQRAAVAQSLAGDAPATIDLAVATPGFTPSRVLHNAADLDALNAMIESETNPGVRSGLFTRRSTILNAYLPAKAASDAADRYRAAVDQLLTKIDEQGRILGVHAQAINTYAAAAPHATLLQTLQSPDLRSAVIDLVAQTSGPTAAAQLRDRLSQLDNALAAVEPPAP